MHTSGISFTFLVGEVFGETDWFCFRLFEGVGSSASDGEPSDVVDCILFGALFGLEEIPRRFREYVAVILAFLASGPKDADRGGVCSWVIDGDREGSVFFFWGDFQFRPEVLRLSGETIFSVFARMLFFRDLQRGSGVTEVAPASVIPLSSLLACSLSMSSTEYSVVPSS